MNKAKKHLLAVIAISGTLLVIQLESSAQSAAQLTVKEIMNTIITPMSATIWGAYQLETDAQWQQIENAALRLIAAGSLLAIGVSESQFRAKATEPAWRDYNTQMIDAARQVMAAVAQKDEEAPV